MSMWEWNEVQKCCDKLIDKYCNYIEVMGGIDNAI